MCAEPSAATAVAVTELKRDDFGRVELLAAAGERRTRRVACGGRWPGSRWVAQRLLQRERRALEQLSGLLGVPGVCSEAEFEHAPSVDGSVPRAADVLVRTWIEGEPLSAAESLPQDFFEQLTALVHAVHARGVCHNDLHKEQNVIVGSDGWPHLIDFQLASTHPSVSSSGSFETRKREDLRHVEKHRRRYLRADGGQAAKIAQKQELPPLERSTLARLWRRGGKPVYNFVTRTVLGTRDGEARRSASGPWPAWGPPRGPRPGACE